MTDTEYATLVAKGYDPHLEQLMMEVDVLPDQARSLTRLVGLTNLAPLLNQGARLGFSFPG